MTPRHRYIWTRTDSIGAACMGMILLALAASLITDVVLPNWESTCAIDTITATADRSVREGVWERSWEDEP